jgi:hypothetical protein
MRFPGIAVLEEACFLEAWRTEACRWSGRPVFQSELPGHQAERAISCHQRGAGRLGVRSVLKDGASTVQLHPAGHDGSVEDSRSVWCIRSQAPFLTGWCALEPLAPRTAVPLGHS